jgi:hypothetical protein
MQPIVMRRQLYLSTPPGAPPEAVMRGIAAELKRGGCGIRHQDAGSVEFVGPSSIYFGFSITRKAAALVSSGVVWLDPATGRVQMELRFSKLYLLLGIVVLLVVVAQDTDAWTRLTFLAIVGGITWLNAMFARSAFEQWIATGALKA